MPLSACSNTTHFRKPPTCLNPLKLLSEPVCRGQKMGVAPSSPFAESPHCEPINRGLLCYNSSSAARPFLLSLHEFRPMIVVRSAQWTALEAAQWERLIAQILPHLREEFPDQWGSLPGDEARRELDAGISSARKLGIEVIGELVRFLEVRTLMGADYGHRPEHKLGLQALNGPAIVNGWPATRELIINMSQGE